MVVRRQKSQDARSAVVSTAKGPWPSRREVLAAGSGAAVTAMLGTRGAAAAKGATPAATFGAPRHGMSAFGDLAYPPGFAHFAYVNPRAPRGGTLSQIPDNTLYNQNFTTFDSLNIYILRGTGARGMELTFTSLMARALDAPDAMYGLAAESVAISSDGLVYRFALRPGTTFHDGSALTAKDVAFSINVLREKGYPLVSQPLRLVASAVGR